MRQNTKNVYNLSGDNAIIGISCGNNKTVIFNGYNVESSFPNVFELGEIFAPGNTLPFPVSVENKGTAIVIINNEGKCTLYSADLGSYITGKIYGEITFVK